jgi:CheY-like chemotaxis protein
MDPSSLAGDVTAPVSGSGAPWRILLAEDNPALAQVIQFNLERAGYTVVAAGDGQEAWQHLEQGPFDLLITDEQMPRVTGRELCARVRESRNHPEMPVVFLTAKCLELDRQRLEDELRVAQVLGKPFSPRQLVETVRQLRLRVPGPA